MSKIAYSPDKPNDCRYCHFWKNNKKGCCLGEDKCYYLISVPQKPKSECDGCPYGRDHPLHRLVYQKDFEGSGGALICMSMSVSVAKSTKAVEIVSIINLAGGIVPVISSVVRMD